MDLHITLSPKNNQHQTPIKKHKLQTHSQIKTAESPSPDKLTLADIDAQELFNEFNRIVMVSEQEEP